MPDSLHKLKGYPTPLGCSEKDGGINFSLFSQHASHVSLCLFKPGSNKPFVEIPLDPEDNKTGWIWHILITGLPSSELEYGYRIDGPEDPVHHYDPKVIVSDPYARCLNTSHQWGQHNNDPVAPLGKIITKSPFDWEGVRPPCIPVEQLVIYEMHVRGFTQHPSSHVKAPGTFLGIIEKIPHFKELGINAIELLPIFEFNECENHNKNPKTQQILHNFWGYSTVNFFAPMNRYATSKAWTGTIDEFRTMVKELHRAGIEIILDVVYNHTAEGNEQGPILSFRGIDNCIYYMVAPDGHYLNYSGTGNTVNANHPTVTKFILDSLRYWVAEMHVDGFRFDIASCLVRDEKGTPLALPPSIQAITHDPLLADVKLIAEPWDAGGLYQVGSFPGGDRWAEWNGKYRDNVRKFIKGTDNMAGSFAGALSGSQELYGSGRHPYHSINFITAHDGFTLRDLVSYQEKHNAANGEENRDGLNENDSWNCGQEGFTTNKAILHLREMQMRNLHLALMVSIGTPMILMGDEYGHTRNGNNNTYCQDNELNWYLWDEIKNNANYYRFFTHVNQFRKENPLFHRTTFLKPEDVDWHGTTPFHPNWSSRFVAYALKDNTNHEDLYIAFNAQFTNARITLPPPPKDKKWYRIVDTSLAPPADFCDAPKKTTPIKLTYDMQAHSALVLKAL